MSTFTVTICNYGVVNTKKSQHDFLFEYNTHKKCPLDDCEHHTVQITTHTSLVSPHSGEIHVDGSARAHLKWWQSLLYALALPPLCALCG